MSDHSTWFEHNIKESGIQKGRKDSLALSLPSLPSTPDSTAQKENLWVCGRKSEVSIELCFETENCSVMAQDRIPLAPREGAFTPALRQSRILQLRRNNSNPGGFTIGWLK